MATRTDICAVCNVEKPVSELRFNKRESDKQYEYQCSNCRKLIAAGELKR